MEWIMDPTVWAGLVTLVVLEIVLGIDNLVFIAILAEKLPKHQRDRARVIGLSLALLMRLLLLTCISYLITLTTPLFIIAGFSFSGRKLIMLAGGIFLLYKATTELNEHLEGRIENENKQRKTARFWPVVAQIVVLDAVFSIDSVITAVGMVHHLPVMMIAVCIAIGLMIWASKPLTQFVTTRPTLIILCLSFLLMIGFSLVAEGFSFEIPKSYLYAAIGFSILIELFNQLSRFNRRRFLTSDRPLRQRTAEAVLRMLGGNHHEEELDEHSANLIYDSAKKGETFNQQERDMIERVLGFGLRNVGSIMTSRHDIELLDINDTNAEILTCLENNQHSRLVVMDSAASDEPLGVIYVNDLLKQQLQNEVFDLSILIKQPLIFPVKASLLMALEQFRQAKTHFAFIVDEFGATEGIVTLTDVLETIAGGLPVEGEEFDPRYDTLREDDGSWVVSGYIPLEDLTKKVPISIEEKRDYHTLAGLLLENMQHIPNQGDYVDIDGLRFTILEVENHRIVNVRITPIAESSLDAPIDG